MFQKNLRYYRLLHSMSKKKLAEMCGLTPMAITNYEKGNRMPNMEILKRLAEVLEVRVSDFLASRNEHLVFEHDEFRKNSRLSLSKQELIKDSVEEYFSRFHTVIELLGGEVLPPSPACHALQMTGDVETDAKAMRLHLGFAEDGPVNELISALENKGILMYVCHVESNLFFGMNGLVNERPYIVVNEGMSPERVRSTIAHELAHLMFDWPKKMQENDKEEIATAIAGAFLFPREDIIRELGIRRKHISKDMALVCREYGISMFLLVKRAQIEGIVSSETAQHFYKQASAWGWRTHEPARIEPERPTLFEQLVFRAVGENDISIQRGAELLKKPYAEVRSHCQFVEG